MIDHEKITAALGLITLVFAKKYPEKYENMKEAICNKF
jgi:hypothetical protein